MLILDQKSCFLGPGLIQKMDDLLDLNKEIASSLGLNSTTVTKPTY